MSEELIQRGLLQQGVAIGPYEFYPIGSTTIRALARARIVSQEDYGEAAGFKPGGVLVDRRERSHIRVLLVIEHKSRSNFATDAQRQAAASQCSERYCKPLRAALGAVTDGETYIWINPQLPGDEYEVILKEDGYPLGTPFEYETEQQIGDTLPLVSKLLQSITPESSQIIAADLLNPTGLARCVWQLLWTGLGGTPSPDSCLATFVEIFVFKYLSDLGLLTTDSTGVQVSFEETLGKGRGVCLNYYFTHVRPHIKSLFPPSDEDGTSVIDGIILDPDIQEHNALLHNILREFEGFGKLAAIDPEFKSRVYEMFLKESMNQKNWGQFFTPRNVVKAIVQMSLIQDLAAGSVVADPACGVGGFLLEPLLQSRQRDVTVTGEELTRRITYIGYDIDPNTIILAKANMLIHLSQLLVAHPTLTEKFGAIFNETFKAYHRSILGSLTNTPTEEYDLVMTNPPYVVAGTRSIKDHIQRQAALAQYYNVPSTGVEGLFIQQIIKSLNKGARALIIVPDGIMNRSSDVHLRRFILAQCHLHAIISLPRNTFYTTPKKTYILGISKKYSLDEPQCPTVFTYLIANTGETLDTKRFACENDLPEMVRLYKYYMADPARFECDDPQCKVIDLEDLAPEDHWSVDRLWSREERLALGLIEEAPRLSLQDYLALLEEKIRTLKDIADELKQLTTGALPAEQTVSVRLGDENYFRTAIGTRVLMKELRGMPPEASIPLYSANVNRPFGHVMESNIEDFSQDSVVWGIDGNFEFNVIKAGIPFATTDHCGRLEVIDPTIDASYVRYALERSKAELDRSLRASLGRVQDITIEIPAKLTEEEILVPDLEEQRRIAETYDQLQAYRQEVSDQLEELRNCEFDV